jgi:hypothetical protein
MDLLKLARAVHAEALGIAVCWAIRCWPRRHRREHTLCQAWKTCTAGPRSRYYILFVGGIVLLGIGSHLRVKTATQSQLPAGVERSGREG